MKKTTIVLITGLSLSGVAQAALHDRGGGLIYDDVLNVTWLQDANYAKTSGYSVNGVMIWSQANIWAANLSYYDSVRNVTYTDWRLPTTMDTGTPGCDFATSGTDCGYNVQTVNTGTNPVTVYSEMAYMYFVNLGLKSIIGPTGAYQPGWGISGNGTFGGQNNVGLIQNLQSFWYWSATEYVPGGFNAWTFQTSNGNQQLADKGMGYYAWAVRPGDVAAVPEPETYVMLLAGLGAMAAAVRRRG